VLGEEKRAGKLCSPREVVSGELTSEGKAEMMEFDVGGSSGGTLAGGEPSSSRCAIPVAISLGQQASHEGYDRVRGRKR
jgi:hypothetical protein